MEHTPLYEHAEYMRIALHPDELYNLMPKIIAILKKFEFEAIAFRGMSGALMAPVIAMRMKKTLIMVRKPNDKTHSKHTVEGDAGAERYIIVDDMVETGKTARAIVKAIKSWSQVQTKCLGVLEIKEVGRGYYNKHSPHLYQVAEYEMGRRVE